MGVIDLSRCPVKTGSIYPEPYACEMAGRSSLRLGEAGGLTQFGANLVILAPGAKSSLRHWHRHEDEFVMVTQGEVVLVQDEGETVMRPGDCAAFPAGDPNGHHFLNRTDAEARFLVVGTRRRARSRPIPTSTSSWRSRAAWRASATATARPSRAPADDGPWPAPRAQPQSWGGRSPRASGPETFVHTPRFACTHRD